MKKRRNEEMKKPMLKDQFGRTHNYLRISLTERCNLRCTYCMPPEGVPLTPKENLMTADEIFELAKIHVGLGITKIRLTGGEPLVRKDVSNIIEKLSKLDVKLTMTTNAVLVDHYIDLLWDNGLRSINISLDTLDKNKFLSITKRDQYERVWKNIETMLEKGFHVKLNCVAMKNFNEDEIIPFIELTKELPLHVRFIEFMPFDGNSWSWDRIISLDDILKQAYSRFEVEKLKDKESDTSKGFQVKDFKGTFSVISSMTDHFCGSCSRIRITADGKIRNCLFSKIETDLLTPLRRGEDIIPLIKDSIWNKKAKHGGINELQTLNSESGELSDRSMILIGG